MAELPIRCTMASVVVPRPAQPEPQVLLLRRAGSYLHGAWTYVAGHLEAGETLWQCALRELAEETGLRPQALYSADCCEQFYDVQSDCIQLVPAFVAMLEGGANVRLNQEHDACRWLSFAEALPELLFDGQRELFARIRREFVERTPPASLQLPLPGSD
jgi:dATP pyrophosphohydrolase